MNFVCQKCKDVEKESKKNDDKDSEDEDVEVDIEEKMQKVENFCYFGDTVGCEARVEKTIMKRDKKIFNLEWCPYLREFLIENIELIIYLSIEEPIIYA
ncbi:MAG: hypothetical protein GY938_22530 [Ketobacter sp.]|nr:hypothetical protein [Ketobacter sp.]